jgi:hypothetical protein
MRENKDSTGIDRCMCIVGIGLEVERLRSAGRAVL